MPVPTDVTWIPRTWGRTPLRTHRDRYTPTICLAATYSSIAMHIRSRRCSSSQHPVVLRMLGEGGGREGKSEPFGEHDGSLLRRRPRAETTGHTALNHESRIFPICDTKV